MDFYDPWLYVSQLRRQDAHIEALAREAEVLRQAVAEAQRVADAPPDLELVAGKDLARALWRRAVSRGKRALSRPGR
jgi:hypothetical protein